MPRHCSAAGCKSRDTPDSRKDGVTFHRLPKRENPRRALWILNSRRTGPQGHGPWDPQSDFIYFCSKHFTSESFELSGVSGYRRLKDDALPTVFETSVQKGRAGKRGARGRPKQADAAEPASTKAATLKSLSDEHGAQQTASDNEDGTGEEASSTSDAAKGKAQSSDEWAGSVSDPSSISLYPSSVVPVAHQSESDAITDTNQEPQPPSSPPRPPSPSRYMRRLPPPPGFYLPKEHSYAQLCPLMWRMQYDRAIDNLERALRLLSAARRRENRLRQTLSRLHESRLKSTLFRLRDGGGGKEGRGAGSRGRLFNSSGGGVENIGMEGAAAEDMEAVGEEVGRWRGGAQGQQARSAGEDEDGCCFYCGRGRDDDAPRDRVQKTARGTKRDGLAEARRRRWATKRCLSRTSGEVVDDAGGGGGGGGDAPKECYVYYYHTPEAEEDLQLVTMQIPQPQADRNPSTATRPLPVVHQQQTTQSCVQLQTVAGVAFQPNSSTVQDSSSCSTPFQLIQSGSSVPQGQILLADVVPIEGQHDSNQQPQLQQQYWLQETAEGSLLLLAIPSSAEDRGAVTVTGLRDNMETQTIFVSDVGFQNSPVGVETEGLRVEGETVCLRAGDIVGGLQTNIRGTVLSGDVREKLKEHLEGFQLQLSNELID